MTGFRRLSLLLSCQPLVRPNDMQGQEQSAMYLEGLMSLPPTMFRTVRKRVFIDDHTALPVSESVKVEERLLHKFKARGGPFPRPTDYSL
jgi:hypothetical protein